MSEHIEHFERKYSVIYEQSAQDDLNNIASFYAKTTKNIDVVMMVLERIEVATNTLKTMPRRCKSVNFYTKGCEIRKLFVPKPPVIVYFEILGECVYVLKIKHSRADQSKIADLISSL
ncbi:type II toxin-antitoxin system RelE/ParE family toxin [Moraxella nasovis]|uniref:type II toxin-antitoxin system RelE/ParE family toxin n=1 Tax=Moraxella nasovis TaxID=2904121 RepID=UPI001F61EB81|nr:type II toxin-antitoxin system RelE/ParE family toxin [Moraxella nasovis]UNU73166.1 type II toxin-antitoxin system RelE/ParE family toxin [Moraxella nasovis]